MTLRKLRPGLDPVSRARLRRAYYQGLLRPVPSSLFCRLLVRRKCGYWPSLARPQTFNEHAIRYSLTVRDAAMAFVADKYLLRDYVRSRIGPGHSAAIIARWGDIATASCKGFPPSFVVKASHGSGFYHIVRNETLSDDRLREILMSWNELNFYWHRREWVYRYMKPRFYAEEYLGTEVGGPDDYRAHVFDGRVKILQVEVGQPHNHRRAFFDRNWEPLPVEHKIPRPEQPPKKPPALGEMIEIAETLGKGFHFVRVDMYAVPEGILVGEMTFCPSAGCGRFGSREQDLFMGRFWEADA